MQQPERWPLLVHVGPGVGILGWISQQAKCGHDECLRDLFLATMGAAWAVAALALILLALPRVVAWVLSLAWIPVGYALGLALFDFFPSLGY